MSTRELLMPLFLAATVAVDLAVVSWSLPRPMSGGGRLTLICLMFSQTGLLAVWTVVGRFRWPPRFLCWALGIALWSWQFELQTGTSAVDVVCLLSLCSAMVAGPLALLRTRCVDSSGTLRPQFSLGALIGTVTIAALTLGLARQFSRPSDTRYVIEMFGIATAVSLTALAAVLAMLGPRITAGRLLLMAMVTGGAGLVLAATAIGGKQVAWMFVLVHTLLVVASLTVWRICGVRVWPERLPIGTNRPPSPGTPGEGWGEGPATDNRW